MIKIIHYIGLDVHKNSIAVAIAVEEGGELRSYGTIGGKLADLDKLIKKLEHPGSGTVRKPVGVSPKASWGPESQLGPDAFSKHSPF